MNTIQFNNIPNNFPKINNVNMSYSNNNNNLNNNNNITSYIPYSDNYPINFFLQNKFSPSTDSNQNTINQFKYYNNDPNTYKQNNINLNNNNINLNLFNNINNKINNNAIIKKEIINKKEETDADLIQGLSGNYLKEGNSNISREKSSKKEIIINLGKIVVNDQILNDFPLIDLKNPSKYDIPLAENLINNEDFFTAIKENQKEENLYA